MFFEFGEKSEGDGKFHAVEPASTNSLNFTIRFIDENNSVVIFRGRRQFGALICILQSLTVFEFSKIRLHRISGMFFETLRVTFVKAGTKRVLKMCL